MESLQVRIPPEFIHNDEFIKKSIASAANLKEDATFFYAISKRSLDARSHFPYYLLTVKVSFEKFEEADVIFDYKNVEKSTPVLIIGAGPAGLFAALRLIELNYKPIIIERGKPVRERRRDLAIINKEGIVNTESNYCFGEGGAGTYSDGKLYTRSNKRGDIARILANFVSHGASPDITIEAHPHIGTNKLPQIIEAMREKILHYGGEIHFDTRMEDIIIKDSSVKGILTNTGDKFYANQLILATGHSARDVFELLYRKNILIEAKPFAMGVRIEHPQQIIDQIQYKCDNRHFNLPPAAYSLIEQVGGRGVFSFCMCPGGIIAPAATADNEIVVNGWSPSKRNNPFANSGFVTEVREQDLHDFAKKANIPFSPLVGMQFQQSIEQTAYKIGGGRQQAPAQRMIDFVENRYSQSLPKNSYLPGTSSANLFQEVLPAPIAQSIRLALLNIQKKKTPFYTNEAILVGTESRTSSPVRIPRDKVTLQHPQIKGLYPCAEGAGYAGGIVSAAMDGENCANAIALE